MRLFETWYFGLCWNLRLVIRVNMISWRILVSLRGFFFCPLGLFLLLCSIMFSTCSQLCSHCVPQIAPHFIPYSLPKSSHFLTCKWIKGEALPSSHKNCYFGNLPRFYFFGWCANQYGPLKNKLKIELGQQPI
jgi:hypothetical protein